ncbi:hypothetical protein [Campylobacter sp. 7477a]|uniref:hypothetical protein n=1 Tax=Campylobacter sp. 7477a TaxID=2735741 RepID=UPI003014B322|nr:TonB C-terminal domain-containing protein [Campylobacter sp. 7477a]
MSDRSKFPTISSFFVALSMYISIILVLFVKLTFFTEPAKKYTDDKDAFMDIVMVESEIAETIKAPKQEEKQKETKPVLKEEVKEEPKQETTNKAVPQEPLPTPSLPTPKGETKPTVKLPPSQDELAKEEPKPEIPDIKDLFKNIDTAKLKEDSGISKPQKVQSRKKSETSNAAEPSSQASDIVKSLQIDSTPKAPKSQMSGVYDPLMGAISKQIQRKWQSYKANSNSVAKIKAVIDGSGNFSYEILELPYDAAFNEKVKECLERLTREKFPFSAGKTISISLSLEDKLE